MNYFLTEEQQMIQETAREIAQKIIKPVALEYDEKNEFPWDVQKKIADAGLFGVYISEEYGGMVPEGCMGIMNLVVAVEELSKQCGGISLCLAATALGTIPIILCGNEEQKKKYLPKLCSGEALWGFGLTEPNAGSDAANSATTAVLDGDEWIINGRKIFITNGNEADYCILIAATDKSKAHRGLSAFIVELDNPGFSVGTLEDKLGIRGSSTAELVFEDCRIPKENLLGVEGKGFKVALTTLDGGRIGIASQALGIARAAIEDATAYAKERVQFGKPIAKLQAIQWMLADLSTHYEAARLLTHRAAYLKDQGQPFGKEAAMAKLMAAETAMKSATQGIQILGGYGYTTDYPLERYFRDAKITEIYEGTSEVMRLVIATNILN